MQTESENDIPIINPSVAPKRLVSVDAYRGFVMLLIMGGALGTWFVSASLPNSAFWRLMAFNQEHSEWAGCSLEDIIQPSFSFVVGVALPFSIASRISKGAKFSSLLKHALIRSLILIVLGIFMRSLWATQTNFTFEDTLSQIGLGYTFLFLLGFCSQRVQIISFAAILIAYWAAFALYPLPGPDFNYAAAGVPQNWEHNFHGFAAHWNKNTNFAWAFDRWFLNLFPQATPFTNNGGGYTTLSFIPTLGTMILGLLAGGTLRSGPATMAKVKHFIITGLCLVGGGVVLHFTGINPIVKCIWTPAWTIFSGGICFLLLALFYGIIDVGHYAKWAFFLIVIGMNSIFAYVMADGLSGFISNTLSVHLGRNFDQVFGHAYSTLVRGSLVILVEWAILYWLYKRKIFIKI